LQSTLASVKSGLPDLAPRNFNFDEKLAKQQWLIKKPAGRLQQLPPYPIAFGRRIRRKESRPGEKETHLGSFAKDIF
jgi:hypothetical protein